MLILWFQEDNADALKIPFSFLWYEYKLCPIYPNGACNQTKCTRFTMPNFRNYLNVLVLQGELMYE